ATVSIQLISASFEITELPSVKAIADRAAAADAVGSRPLALAAPLRGAADDLKRIRGIGPANEKKLHGIGVYHFSQIAAWSAENARWAGSFMAFPGRIERENWIDQAKVLATGAETEFSKRVDAGEVASSKPEGA
ncbi:MAG: cell envelope biogenesis protein TolA, partial [Siculibacillus sp.]|nr:cell envelope biogenesis protein TolA [Siculibacillus sp.]